MKDQFFLWSLIVISSLFSCNTDNPAIGGSEASRISVMVNARAQSYSQYRITISAYDMDTIGPGTYEGGQSIRMYVPEGNDRRVFFERFNADLELTDTGTTVVDIGPGLNKVEVTLKSAIPVFSVTYHDNMSGDTPIDTNTYRHGQVVTIKDNNDTLQTGYLFAGWNRGGESEGKVYTPGDTVIMGDEDVDLYALWNQKPLYSITYIKDSDARGDEPVDFNSYEQGQAVIVRDSGTMHRPGYSFAGWSKNEQANDKVYTHGDTLLVDTSGVRLYTVWDQNPEYAVIFDKNDSSASGSMPSQSIISGTVVTLNENQYFREGWSFAGWAQQPGGPVVYSNNSSFSIDNANDTLYAIWTQKPVFTVVFNKNDTLAYGTMAAQTIVSETSVNLFSNEYSKTGYAFIGWSQEPSGDVLYEDGASFIMGSENVNLYAKWEKNPEYTITYEKIDSSATGTMPQQTIVSGITTNLLPCEFLRDGWSFSGWATTPEGEIDYTDEDAYTMDTADVTLYAKWTRRPLYSVIFNKNDFSATGTMPAQDIPAGSTVNLIANRYTKPGYSFSGWAPRPDGEIIYQDSALYTMGNQSVTLYARWTLNPSFSVIFMKNAPAASGNMQPQEIVSELSADLNLNAFSNTGWSFRGWATDPDGEVLYNDGASLTMGTSDITLYAKWDVDSYTITYDKNDPSATGSMDFQEVTFDSNVTILDNEYTRSGRLFDGWAIEPDGEVLYEGGESITAGAKDLALYAKWTNKVRIMCVGDGNTVGYNGHCYRAFLKGLMFENGWEVDFVGTKEQPPYNIDKYTWNNTYDVSQAAKDFIMDSIAGNDDVQHEGIYDRGLLSLVGNGTTQAEIDSFIADTLHFWENDFDIMLLMIGTNSISASYNNAIEVYDSLAYAVTGISNFIEGRGKDQKLLLATVPAQRDETYSVIDTNIIRLNGILMTSSVILSKTDAIADMYNPSYDIGGGSAVELKETFADRDKRYFTSDGYNIIAHEWWDKIQSILP